MDKVLLIAMHRIPVMLTHDRANSALFLAAWLGG